MAEMDASRTNTTEPRPVPRWALPALLAVGLVVRLALSSFGGYGYDMYILGEWSSHLVDAPLGDFYAVADRPDHLPGDLWLLYAVAHIYRWVMPLFGDVGLQGTSYEIALKTVPAIADLAIATMLYRILRYCRSTRAGLLAAAAFLINPATIFLTSIWGQWDSVSAAAMLVSIEMVLRGRYVAAVPLWVWAVLIKPQLALLVPLLLIKPLRETLLPGIGIRANLQRLWQARALEIVSSVLVALVTVELLILPWGVGLPGMPMQWSLLDRLDAALNLYTRTSMNAFNLWQFLAGAGVQPDDRELEILNITAQTWGMLLLVAAWGFIVVTCWRLWVPGHAGEIFVWGALATAMAAFMLPTRVHERYLFPAIAFAILLAGFRPRQWWLAAGLSLTFLANLLYVYNRNNPPIVEGLVPIMASDLFLRGISLANLVLFGVVLGIPARLRHSPALDELATARKRSPGAGSAPAPAVRREQP